MSKDEIFKLLSRARRFGAGSDREEEAEETEVEQEVTEEDRVERGGGEDRLRLREGRAEVEAETVGESLRL